MTVSEYEVALVAVLERIAAALERERPEPRDGIAHVYGPTGAYLGCVGVERWQELVADEAAREAYREAARDAVARP